MATKANRAELKTMSSEVNELVQSLILRVMNQEDNWKKSVEQLSKELGTKLIRSDLAELKADLGRVWKILRKAMSEGIQYDPDSAAVFKRKLFEQVQCLSCDRSLEMMTSPQLLTIRKGQLLSKLRPSSANSYDYLQQQQMREEQLQDLGTCDDATLSASHHWASNLPIHTRPTERQSPLLSLYPYGEPNVTNYDSAEVDILGVDGVLYKGRMDSQDQTSMTDGEKERAVMKIPHPPARGPDDRGRHGPYTNLYPPLRQPTAQPPDSAWPQSLLPPLPPPLQDPQPVLGLPRLPRNPMLEPQVASQPREFDTG